MLLQMAYMFQMVNDLGSNRIYSNFKLDPLFEHKLHFSLAPSPPNYNCQAYMLRETFMRNLNAIHVFRASIILNSEILVVQVGIVIRMIYLARVLISAFV